MPSGEPLRLIVELFTRLPTRRVLGNPDSPGPLGIGTVFSKYALHFSLHVPSRQLVEHPRDQQIDNEIRLGHEAILSAMYLEHPLHVEEQ